MTDHETDKSGMKFWVAALAFSMLLVSLTFAILASFLADIKGNTEAALSRTDLVTQRLNTMEMEMNAIHHHIMAEKEAGMSGAMSPGSAGMTVEGAVPPAAIPATPPAEAPAVVQPPSMAAPATTKP